MSNLTCFAQINNYQFKKGVFTMRLTGVVDY